jgi:hypothetical protein
MAKPDLTTLVVEFWNQNSFLISELPAFLVLIPQQMHRVFGVRHGWVQVLAPSFTNCVTISKLAISEISFFLFVCLQYWGLSPGPQAC